jgi:hypothetical protein
VAVARRQRVVRTVAEHPIDAGRAAVGGGGGILRPIAVAVTEYLHGMLYSSMERPVGAGAL